MISHIHRCIFIHIPKCAGTSVEKLLGHHAEYTGRGKQDHRTLQEIQMQIAQDSGAQDLIYQKISRINAARLEQGFHVLNIYNFNIVTHQQYYKYFKFCLVRNPWSRAYSWYKNVMRDEVHRQKLAVEIELSLFGFLSRYVGVGMLASQLTWILDRDGKIGVDFVGRFENLENDFAYVASILDLGRYDLPRELTGYTENYHDHYDCKSKDLIWRAYKEEIGLFNYEF